MSFSNTEQIVSFSGVTGTFTRFVFDQVVKCSGGHVFVAGPVVVNAILPFALSGASLSATYSGQVLSVSHGTSGMIALESGTQIFHKNYGTHSGTDSNTAAPSPLQGLMVLCRSGVNILVSGGHFGLTVVYAGRTT